MDFKLKGLSNSFDIDISGQRNDVVVDGGLDTSALMSIFSNRRVDNEGGYWGDFLSDFLNDFLGSRVWRVLRKRNSQDTREDIASAIRESLNWMLADSVAQEINVRVDSLDENEVTFALDIRDFSDERLTAFSFLWDFHRNEISTRAA